MKKNFKSDCKKRNRKTILKHLSFLLFFIGISAPIMTNAQTCYCDESGSIIIGSGVGVETVSEAISLGLLDPAPSPTSQTQYVCVKGDLSVDLNYNFYNLQVNMYTGASITVESYIELRMGGDTELFGCSVMWNSVIVESFATLKLRGVTIRDGEVAVDAKALSNLFINGNSFISNYIAISASSKNNNAVSFVNLLSPVQGNSFSTAFGAYLKSPHAGELAYAGIQLQNIAGFTVGVKGSTTGGGFFSRIKNGIIAHNSNFAINGANLSPLLFTNIIYDPLLPDDVGNGILMYNSSAVVKGCGFYNTIQGIFAFNSSIDAANNVFPDRDATGIYVREAKNKKITISGNEMECWGVGIGARILENTSLTINGNEINMIEESDYDEYDGFTGIFLEECHFNAHAPSSIYQNNILLSDCANGIILGSSTGVSVTGNPNISFESIADFDTEPVSMAGIWTRGGGGHQIIENHITGLGPSVLVPNNNNTFAPFCSILAWRNTGNLYCCNTISDTQYGIRFEGTNFQTNLKATSIGDHVYGLNFDPDGVISEQDGADNAWLGDYDLLGAWHENITDPTYVEMSTFKVETLGLPETPDYPDDILPDPTVVQWFTTNGADPIECCETPGIVNGPPDRLDLAIAADTVDSGTLYSETGQWLLKRGLFAKLDANPSMLQSYSSMATFYNNNVNTTVGKFHQMQKNIAQLAGLPTSETGQYLENVDSIQFKMWALVENDSLLDIASTYDSTMLLANQQTILSEMASWENENDSLEVIILAYQAGLAQQYITQNAAISATEIYETNEKTVNDIYLNTVAQNNFSLTTQQIAELDSIVWQCPDMGGEVVLRARVLYSLAVDTTFDDRDLCTPPTLLQQGGDNHKIAVSYDSESILYPNPTDGNFTLYINEGVIVDKVNIVNLSGQVLATHLLEAGQKTPSFSTASIPSGIYIVELLDGGTKILSEKLVVNH